MRSAHLLDLALVFEETGAARSAMDHFRAFLTRNGYDASTLKDRPASELKAAALALADPEGNGSEYIDEALLVPREVPSWAR